jgi:hypothetical protein
MGKRTPRGRRAAFWPGCPPARRASRCQRRSGAAAAAPGREGAGGGPGLRLGEGVAGRGGGAPPGGGRWRRSAPVNDGAAQVRRADGRCGEGRGMCQRFPCLSGRQNAPRAPGAPVIHAAQPWGHRGAPPPAPPHPRAPPIHPGPPPPAPPSGAAPPQPARPPSKRPGPTTRRPPAPEPPRGRRDPFRCHSDRVARACGAPMRAGGTPDWLGPS